MKAASKRKTATAKTRELVHPPKELTEKVMDEYNKVLEAKGDKRVKSGKKVTLSNSGSIIVGEKGMLYSPDDYGGSWELVPAEAYHDFKAPEPTLPRNKDGGDEGQKIEWLAASQGRPSGPVQLQLCRPAGRVHPARQRRHQEPRQEA